MRIVCHALVDLMPEAALRETLESLKEAWEFYRLPPPPPALLPHTIRIPVTLGKTYERPDFHVVEE